VTERAEDIVNPGSADVAVGGVELEEQAAAIKRELVKSGRAMRCLVIRCVLRKRTQAQCNRGTASSARFSRENAVLELRTNASHGRMGDPPSLL
jgi:hypothetical protein